MDNDLKWLITLTAFGLIMIGLTQYYSDMLHGPHWALVKGMSIVSTLFMICLDVLYYADYEMRRRP